MKRLIYQVYVGEKSELYEECTASVKRYADKHGITYVKQTIPKLMVTPDPFNSGRSKEAVSKLGYLPIYEKENVLDFLPSYDQVAVVDADIWIRDDAPNVFDIIDDETDFAAVAEREMPVTKAYANKIKNYSRMQYASMPHLFSDYDNDYGYEFFNMGFILMNNKIKKYLNGECAREFIQRPEFKNFVDGKGSWKWSTDQTLLNFWIKNENMNVQHLDWKWNGLYKGIEDSKIKDAHFVHFFLKDKLPDKGENVKKLLKDVS